jgi:hypothetical protein
MGISTYVSSRTTHILSQVSIGWGNNFRVFKYWNEYRIILQLDNDFVSLGSIVISQFRVTTNC